MRWIRLTKAWGPHESGAVIQVDDLRAAMLFEQEAAVPADGLVTTLGEGVEFKQAAAVELSPKKGARKS